MTSIKILTWNILGGSDFEKEIIYIREVNPDIFCLQEVQLNYPGYYDEGKGMDVLTAFKAAFPEYHSAYAPINHRIHEGKQQAFGNAIFSRFKITEEHAVYFRKPADWTLDDHQNQSRNILLTKLDVYGQALFVATGHLTYEPFFKDTLQQEEEAQKIVETLKDKENVILTGDFNSLPDSKVVQKISEIFKAVSEQDFFTFARIPWSYKDFSVDKLKYKLDYIFHSPHLKSKNIILPDTELSDHLPLAAEIEIR